MGLEISDELLASSTLDIDIGSIKVSVEDDAPPDMIASWSDGPPMIQRSSSGMGGVGEFSKATGGDEIFEYSWDVQGIDS